MPTHSSVVNNQRPVNSAPVDFDDLHDYMGKYIREALSEARRTNVLFPTIDARKLTEIELKLQDLKKIDDYISVQLKILDRELNIVDLELKSKPIREAIQKLKSLTQTSHTMVALSQQITANIDTTSSLTKSLNQQLSSAQLQTYEQPLEKLMDDCEKINEKIDALSDKPFVVNLIKPRYEQLVMLVMLLQDKFESYE